MFLTCVFFTISNIFKIDSMLINLHYIYIYAFSRHFYPKRLTYAFSLYIFFFVSMRSLGIEPTTFALLTLCSNHWATGTQKFKIETTSNIILTTFQS